MPLPLPVIGPARRPRLVEESALDLRVQQAKLLTHQALRLARWQWDRTTFAGQQPDQGAGDLTVSVYDHEIQFHRNDADVIPELEAGKRINVALAVPSFNGLVVTPERPLSFWRVLGRITAAKGYQHGMEVRGGCIVPAMGGGICLLSNALFQMAAELGWTILERHGHTRELVAPPQGELWGLDATVLWPHVDLVVAPVEGPVRLGLRVVGDVLRLTVHAQTARRTKTELSAEADRTLHTPESLVRENRIRRRIQWLDGSRSSTDAVIAENRKQLVEPETRRRSCLSCGETSCHSRVELPAVRR